MNCTICKLPTGNIVGSVLPQGKCGWQAPQPPVTQRTWVGLFDEEIWQIATGCTIGGDLHADKFARAIESKLKEVNT